MYRLFAGDMALREQVIEPLSSGERRDNDVLEFRIFVSRLCLSSLAILFGILVPPLQSLNFIPHFCIPQKTSPF